MSKVIDLSKKFNHRWKTDPLFVKGFDYDHPKYANVADDLKWMLPLFEYQKNPAVKAEQRRLMEAGHKKACDDIRAARKAKFRIVSG